MGKVGLRYSPIAATRPSQRLGLLHPAPPHTRLGVKVLLAEDAFHILLLALDLVALYHVHYQRQEQDGLQRVREGSYLRVDRSHREVGGVAGVAKRSVSD